MSNYTTKQCLICGNSFRTAHHKQNTCGRICAAKRRFGTFEPIYQPETDTYLIPLTHGYHAVIDAEDIVIANVRWHAAVQSTGTVYAMHGLTMPNGKRRNGYLHRLIIERTLERELVKGEMTDHINGDGLDCRRQNLRLATCSQNGANRKINSNSTSGLKGVFWNKHKNTWQSVICVEGKSHHLGSFRTPEAAHEAYADAAKRFFGEYANDGLTARISN
jgi:hypothetical protein